MDASLNTLMQLAGAAACAVVAAVAARDGWSWWQRRRARLGAREADRQAFAQLAAAVARKARLRDERRRGWEGVRPLRVVAVVDECRGVRSIYLTDPEGRRLPDFLPGQHLTVHLPITPGLAPEVRCYSLSDRPREESYRISVKRVPPKEPGGAPGLASGWLHDRIDVGDTLMCGAPSGDFYLSPDESTPAVLIGAGVGVTPLLSMALQRAHEGVDRDTYLVLGARNRDELPFRSTIEQLRTVSPRLKVVVALSQPEAAATIGVDYQHAGRVTIGFLRSLLPSNNFRFYVCGPPPLMHELIPGLLDWGTPDDQIYFEAFGPSSVPRRDGEDPAAAAVGLPVRFAQRGAEAVWSEDCQNLLDLAERSGVPLESGCRVGNCGRCATPVVEGSVKTIRRPGAATPAGKCLACISVPTSPLVLDA